MSAPAERRVESSAAEQSEALALGALSLRLTFVTDIITPYNATVFEALAQLVDLTVIYCSQTGTRAMPWDFSDGLPFRHRVLSGLTIKRRILDGVDYHVDPRIFSAIAATSPDAVVASGFSLPTMYASLYCNLRGRPLTVHSDGTSWSERELNRVKRLSRAIVLRHVSTFVANSQPAAARFREMGVAPERIFMAPHTTRLDPLWAVGRRRTYTPGRGLKLLAIGRLRRVKAFDDLLRALAVARATEPTITLTIVGSGPEEGSLRRLAERLGLADVVGFVGFVEHAHLPSHYAAADALAFPSRRDTFGFVLLEGAAAGLPIVASSHAGATADLLENERSGLVLPSEDVEGNARAFVRLARSGELRERLGRAAYAATLGRSPAVSAAGYLEAVDAARCSSRPAPSLAPISGGSR